MSASLGFLSENHVLVQSLGKGERMKGGWTELVGMTHVKEAYVLPILGAAPDTQDWFQ
jgi:hypothetical protein